MSYLRPRTAFTALFLSLAACGGGDDDGTADDPADDVADDVSDDAGDDSGDDGAPVDPTCVDAEGKSDLAYIEENIFGPSCAAFSACHMGGNPAAGLSLEPGLAEAALVGIDSEGSDLLRVAPGDPENSYLMLLMGQYGVDNPLVPANGTMPKASDILCVEKRDAVEAWILSL